MNYYERHLGDYARDAGHLSLLEEGVFTRLLDRYYATERGIPDDQALRVARAGTKPEIAAVHAVLTEFFTLIDGVWVNKRAELVIAKYRDKSDKAKASVNKRWENARNTNVERTNNEGNTPRARSSNQYPVTSTETTAGASAENSPSPTTAGLACRAMREAGCVRTNPSHPDLLAALGEGVTAETLADTVREAIADHKRDPFAYAITTARNRHAEGARPVITGPPRARSPSLGNNAVATILGASHGNEIADPAMVRDSDSRGDREPLRPQPRRLSGG